MERIRQLLSEIFQSIPRDLSVEIFGGIIAAVGIGVLVIFKDCAEGPPRIGSLAPRGGPALFCAGLLLDARAFRRAVV